MQCPVVAPGTCSLLQRDPYLQWGGMVLGLDDASTVPDPFGSWYPVWCGGGGGCAAACHGGRLSWACLGAPQPHSG